MRIRPPRALLSAASALLLAAPAAASPLPPDEPLLAPPAVIDALSREISGETAFAYTARISGFDRIQGSPGWHDAALAIQAELERQGWTGVELEGWPSDGTRRYATYRSVIGWRGRKAELWMTSPSLERLCSFDEVPLTLVKHSGSGAADAAELVDVGAGVGDESYAGRDVRGKIVLSTGPSGEVVRQAVMRRGALGVLTYYPADVRPGYPQMVRYTSIWPRWEERDRLGFAFNISKNQGARLQRLLQAGQKVVLKADVRTEFFPTELETLSVAMRGTREPDREVLLVAHLCHPAPSANDNASGSGGLLEMARALKRLVDERRIEPPARTIRFLWVPEFNGTMPYVLAHLERTRRTAAVVNCDMIGEDLHLTGGVLNVFRAPQSVPTVLNDVVANFARAAERLDLRSLNGSDHPFAWRLQPYGGGSDHVVFGDGSLRVPAVMLNRDDIFHHTSLDSLDKVDPTELRRACFVALGSAWFLASAGDREAVAAAALTARNGLARAAADYYDAAAGMASAESGEALAAACRRTVRAVDIGTRREIDSVRSAAALAQAPDTRREIDRAGAALQAAGTIFRAEALDAYRARRSVLNAPADPLAATPAEVRLDGIVPVRAADFVGPLDGSYLEEKLGAGAGRALDLDGDVAFEALNFVDGARSVRAIVDALTVEFGPVSAAAVESYFDLLSRAGLLTLGTRGGR